MRTTMHTIHQGILTNLTRITSGLNLANAQISSGKLISKPSDDPVNLVGALGLRSNLAEIQQYQRNLLFGDNFVTFSETALSGTKELAIRAKELAIGAVNGASNPANRASMAEEVHNLFEQAIVFGNTQVNGKYIFGGYRTTGYTDAEPAPFVADLDDGYRVNGNTLTGVALNADELFINGIAVPAAGADGISTINDNRSAAAMKAAVNAVSEQTGVTAKITAATRTGAGQVLAGTLNAGDLLINGVDIFPAGGAILASDRDNVLVDAINAQEAATGVVASRDSSGKLILTAVDGRNLQVTTTANGEAITNLNGAASAQVYYGSLQLHSDRIFTLATAAGGEPGLVALGLDGGGFQSDDTGGDGTLVVHDIAEREGYVRYAGDRGNNIAIKVGANSTLDISKNGKEALKDTGVFTVLKKLEGYLRGESYHEATSAHAATDTTITIGSGGTGLDKEDEIVSGSFAVTLIDHERSPAQSTVIHIPVDPANDSLDDIAARLNHLPGMAASWDGDGHLQVSTTDPERFSFTLSEDTSNILETVGIDSERMQVDALANSMAALDELMDGLANHVSDFGARGNRIEAQGQILSNLETANAENLSAKEDTDVIKALIELKSKETAYQAALTAASKTMQLSLVDFLR